jgi:hypothetical protein
MKKEIIEKNINHESIFTRNLKPGQTNFKIKQITDFTKLLKTPK